MILTVQQVCSAGGLFYLKSLSLEVIFSSRLEMWYEALAMSVLLAVSLLLADCALCLCVFRLLTDWLAVCVSVCLSVLLVWFFLGKLRLSNSSSATATFSLSTATVASRGAEFGLFEWSSRSLCRGAGLALWTLRGWRSEFEPFIFHVFFSSHSQNYYSILIYFNILNRYIPCM